MELLLQQLTAGLATGAIYAAMALAVVMIYQAIDHLNFAQGEMAMFSTFLAWQMIQWGQPYWVAFIAAVALSFLGGIAIERVLFKPIRNAPILSQLVAFIALYSILNSSAGEIWDFTIKTFPSPFGTAPLFGQNLISTHQAGMIGVTLVMLGSALSLFPRIAPRAGDARRCGEPRVGASRRHSRRLDAGARLGDVGGGRRGRGHADRSGGVPRAEHDAGRAALRFCGCRSRRPVEPRWCCGRRVCRRGDREPRRDLHSLCRARVEADDRPGGDRRGADG